jgi:hypothetical protein
MPWWEVSQSQRVRWLAFAGPVLGGFAFFFVPAFIIRPFRHQTAGALSWALAIRQFAPQVTLVAVALALAAALLLWRRVARVGKVVLAAGMALVVGSAVMARVNYFEWMFHHLRAPGFEAASASKLGASEMVLAVHVGDDARAYPVREMAYHHVVNDTVGGVPIVVTY